MTDTLDSFDLSALDADLPPPPNPVVRLLSAPEVMDTIGCSRMTLHRWVAAGTFPGPIRTGPNSVRWRADEVQRWIDSRERVRDVGRA